MTIDVFSKFIEKLVESIPKLLQADQKTRDEIIDVVSDLSSNLTRGLTLYQTLIDGVRPLLSDENEIEIRTYIDLIPSKLFKDFSEFNVCRGLRKTKDRAHRSIPIIQASLNLKNIDDIIKMIDALDNNEKLIYDIIFDDVDKLRSSISLDKKQIISIIETSYERCSKMISEIRTLSINLIRSL